MPTQRTQTVTNFRRGLKQIGNSLGKLNSPEGDFSELLNWYLAEGVMRMRPPSVIWPMHDATPALIGTAQGFLALKTSTGVFDTIVLGSTTITNFVFGGTSANLSDPMALAFGANATNRWSAVQYKDYGYAVRPDLNYIIRLNDASFWSAGIAAPSTAAVLADGGVGTGEAGTFYGVFTFVDADGVESGVSPISNAVTVAVNRYISWTSVDVSTNPRVTARNLYRTLPNQTGEYFYVAQIANNTGTASNEAVLTANMGDLAPTTNAVPPTVNYLDIEVAFERLWAIDASYLYGSAAEDPDNFPADNVYSFAPDDGQALTGIQRLGTRLMVGKTGSVWALVQSLGEFEFLPIVVDEKTGPVHSQVFATGGGFVFWFDGMAIFKSDGRTPGVNISTGRVFLATSTNNEINRASMAVNHEKGWLLFHLSSNTYVYDYVNDTWARFFYNVVSTVATAPYFHFLKSAVDSDGRQHVFAGMIGDGASGAWIVDLFPYYTSNPDYSQGDVLGDDMSGTYTMLSEQILCKATFAPVNFGAPGQHMALTRVRLLTRTPDDGGYTDANTYLLKQATVDYDGNSRTRSSILIYEGTPTSRTKAWKNVGLSSQRGRGTVITVNIQRESRNELIIEGIQYQGHVWGSAPKELT